MSEKKDYRRGNLNYSIWPLLWDLESQEKYRISDRWLYEHAKTGRILGVGYDHGKWIIEGDPRNLIGPVPAEPRIYLKPKGAGEHIVQLVPNSPISSKIWCKELGVKFISLSADISGAWVQVLFR